MSSNQKFSRKSCYYTTNFWQYDRLLPPFDGLPTDFYRIYVTDQNDTTTVQKLLAFGWDEIYSVKLPVEDNFNRRKFTSQARLFPELFAPLRSCEQVFFTDADIVIVQSSLYQKWARSMSDTTALLVMLGGYSGERDDIEAELSELYQQRWKYNWKNITERTRYYQRLIQAKTNSTKARVSSAKYLGWNMAHPQRHVIAEWLFHEASVHIQGNIAISAAVVLFLHLVQAMNCSLWARAVHHRQSY